MKPKTLAALALVVGALAATVFLFEKDLPSTDERTARAKKVVPVKGDELVAIEIDWQGKIARLERAPKGAADAAAAPPSPRPWQLVEPFATRADAGLVDTFAGQLTALEAKRDLEGASPADVGLDPPRGKVTWKTATASGSLAIGGEIPASNEIVVASSERTLPAVVDKGIVAQLEREPGEWRSREAVPATRAEIERVTLEAPGRPPVILAQSGETLRLEAPVADVAERERVDALLTALTGLRMETFLDPPLTETAKAALAAPTGTVELAIAGRDEPYRIVFGGEPVPGKRTVRAGEQAFIGSTNLLEEVTRPVADWRSHHWSRFETWRVERVTIEDAAGRMALERKDGQWYRDGVEIGFAAASDLLYALSSAQADEIQETAAAGKPALTFTLADADGNEETLSLGEPGAAGTPAIVSGRDLVLILPSKVAEEVRSKLGAVRAAPAVVAPAPDAAGDSEPAPGAAPPSG